MKYKDKYYPLKALSCLAGLFFLTTSASAQVTEGCEYTDAALFGGWGWNPTTQQSCPPQDTDTPDTIDSAENDTGSCDYSNAALSGGWGWDSVALESCPPIEDVANNSNEPTIDTNPACVDSDGDGFGWDGVGTCIVGAAVPVTPTTPGNSGGLECVDPDGDGFGWDGSATCIVGSTPIAVPENPTTPSTPGALACIDSDGDGFGWNGVESCVPDQVSSIPVAGDCTVPTAGETRVSTTGPVRSTGNSFYPDNGPQCVTPDNQFNGPGLGFGDFLLINNAWNGATSTADWLQCIALSADSSGTVTPSWSYDWGNEDDLQPGFREWEVKSFPEILYGAKSETELSAPCTTTGLPIQYSEMPDIDISYSYRATQTNNRIGDLGDENNNPVPVTGGDRNIAVESFLHSSCDIQRGDDSNREFELMVWLDHGAERLPSGSPPVSTYTDSSGRLYDIYVKGQADPGYIAYVARNEVTSGVLDWDEFFTDAKDNADTYGVKAINDNWCLANILFGSEIWWGEGGLTLDYYQITQSY